jgi:hypothetical protein
LAQIEYCNCSQKGNYSLGIVTLDSGELACKNCRGVIPLSDISEGDSQLQPPEPKQRIAKEYLAETATKPQKSATASNNMREEENRENNAVQGNKELTAYLDSIDKSLVEILSQLKATNLLLFIFFGIPALVGFFVWLFVFSGI